MSENRATVVKLKRCLLIVQKAKELMGAEK